MNEKIDALKNSLIDYIQKYIDALNNSTYYTVTEKNVLIQKALNNLKEQLLITGELK